MSKKSNETKQQETNPMSKDEQIGFHKGSLSTLSKERQEMVRILQIVEQLMQMHISALTELGVKLDKETEGTTHSAHQKKPEKPIEDLL